jgi:hypothetical protein
MVFWQLMQPWLAKNCTIILRHKSLYLLREALRLAATAPSSLRIETTLPSEWCTHYWVTLEETMQHIAHIYPRMLQSNFHSDLNPHTLCLKSCLIFSLTAEIKLHTLPEFIRVESRQRALSLITDVTTLIQYLKDEDYTMLEPMLGVGIHSIMR